MRSFEFMSIACISQDLLTAQNSEFCRDSRDGLSEVKVDSVYHFTSTYTFSSAWPVLNCTSPAEPQTPSIVVRCSHCSQHNPGLSLQARSRLTASWHPPEGKLPQNPFPLALPFSHSPEASSLPQTGVNCSPQVSFQTTLPIQVSSKDSLDVSVTSEALVCILDHYDK